MRQAPLPATAAATPGRWQLVAHPRPRHVLRGAHRLHRLCCSLPRRQRRVPPLPLQRRQQDQAAAQGPLRQAQARRRALPRLHRAVAQLLEAAPERRGNSPRQLPESAVLRVAVATAGGCREAATHLAALRCPATRRRRLALPHLGAAARRGAPCSALPAPAPWLRRRPATRSRRAAPRCVAARRQVKPGALHPRQQARPSAGPGRPVSGLEVRRPGRGRTTPSPATGHAP